MLFDTQNPFEYDTAHIRKDAVAIVDLIDHFFVGKEPSFPSGLP